MSIFGTNWKNHVDRIKIAWDNNVKRDDIVIIAGDISWATKIEEAKKDFNFIEKLPGKKIITVGNHDYWHQTSRKSTNWFFEQYETIVPLFRSDYINLYDDIAICSVKGYMNENHPEFKPEFRKGYERECLRLERTLNTIPETFEKIILVSHYPPLHKGYSEGKNLIMEIIDAYSIDTCIYGHLHGEAVEEAFIGEKNGTNFIFVAGDSYNFKPLTIIKEI